MSSEKEQVIGSAGNVQFELLKNSLTKSFQEHFTSYPEGLVRGKPGGFVCSQEYARHADELLHFQPRGDDVWIVTFPKCGTTWTQELVWMVMNGCDKEAGKQPLNIRSPFLEFPYLASTKMQGNSPQMTKMISVEMVEKMASPRVIKSHLPLYLLHPNLLDTSKVVYVVRNPKDVIVSFFYHHKLIKIHQFNGTLDEFAQYFMDDEVFYSPFFPHALEAWALRSHPNMLFLFYEDMKRDLKGEIERVAHFLGKTLTEQQMTALVEHLGFENFAKNESVNFEVGKDLGFMNTEGRFIRKGETGDWKNHFSAELNERVDKWIEKNLEGTDLKFVTELK